MYIEYVKTPVPENCSHKLWCSRACGEPRLENKLTHSNFVKIPLVKIVRTFDKSTYRCQSSFYPQINRFLSKNLNCYWISIMNVIFHNLLRFLSGKHNLSSEINMQTREKSGGQKKMFLNGK